MATKGECLLHTVGHRVARNMFDCRDFRQTAAHFQIAAERGPQFFHPRVVGSEGPEVTGDELAGGLPVSQ